MNEQVKHFAGSARLYVDAEISLKLLTILTVLKRCRLAPEVPIG